MSTDAIVTDRITLQQFLQHDPPFELLAFRMYRDPATQRTHVLVVMHGAWPFPRPYFV